MSTPDQRPAAPAAGDGLRAEAVNKQFAGVKALQGVDVQVQLGDLVGLIGPNGSGKTTLVNILSGFFKATSGRVCIDRRDVSTWPPHRIARQGVCRTFQNVRLFNRLTVLENVEVGAVRADPKASARKRRDRAREALRELDIEAYADRRAAELPYGIQRRVDIARAVAAAPAFMLLDEPAAGLNELETKALGAKIAEIHAQSELGILIIDHDLSLITSLCERIVVLDSGVVIARGSPDQVTSAPAVIEAYLGSPADAHPAVSRQSTPEPDLE